MILATLALLIQAAEPGAAARVALQPVAETPGLPRVLLIGDSISIGYTIPARAALQGKANVQRIPENAATAAHGVHRLNNWLGNKKWDVIHFNFGLHDLKRLEDGERQILPEQYERSLRWIVWRLKQTGAKLIFATTTPVPEGKLSPPRLPSDVPFYNAIARRIMQENGIAVNDLYEFALPRLQEWQRPVNVHFVNTGSAALGERVAAVILQTLEAK